MSNYMRTTEALKMAADEAQYTDEESAVLIKIANVHAMLAIADELKKIVELARAGRFKG